MIRKLFLYGGLSDNFAQILKPFVDASGGKDAKIVILQQGGEGWKNNDDKHKSLFNAAGAENIEMILPESGFKIISESNKQLIRESTGIFIWGGDTSIYNEIYCDGEIGEVIKRKYYSCIPYAGLSAGAILAAERFCGYEYGNGVYTSYGFLKNTLVEPHFIERNGFRELLNQFDKIGFPKGLGINEDICLEITNETDCLVHGKSEGYLINKTDPVFELIRYKSGMNFKI